MPVQEGDTPLIDAVRRGRVAVVAVMLADGTYDVNEPMINAFAATPLYVACEEGHAAIVTKLLAAKADVGRARDNGCTPLYVACQLGHTEIVTTLLAANADVNQPTNNDCTPLSITCEKGHIEIATKLLAANANANQAIYDGCTPLYIASYNGHTDIVTTLLAANADVNQAQMKGCSPLYIACAQGHTNIVTKLLAANANVDQDRDNGATPLYVACEKGQAETAAKLLAAESDVNKAMHDGSTPLLIACQKGHTEIAAALLAANATVNQAMNNGVTPMYVAGFNGHLGCVQLLSSYGASRTWPFAAPWDTAEHVATHRGHHDTAAWLATSRDWSAIHHLEALTPARALALLRGGASVTSFTPGAPTPLDRAKGLCTVAAAAGSAAHVVLEWGAPWSRETHRFYPPSVRARVAALMVIGQRLKHADRFLLDVWETYVVPHDIASEMWR